jgi:hypothetical protein
MQRLQQVPLAGLQPLEQVPHFEGRFRDLSRAVVAGHLAPTICSRRAQ